MKYLLSLGCIFLLIQKPYAQLRIHTGGGANFSDINFKNIEVPKINAATNYFISVRPEIGLTKSISASLDIQFSRKGYFFAVPSSTLPETGYRFQYLDLIPQAQLKIFGPVSLFGGLGIGIRASEKTNINNVWSEAKTKLSKPTDFTYVAGLRFFPLKKISAHVQFAGTLGSFLDVEWSDAQGNLVPNASTKLNNYQIGIGYQFY